MFIQAIRGRAKDEAGLRKQIERWREDLAPGATGWLGTTAGIGSNGEFLAVARFESEDAARKNSDRPEQGEWWNETSQYFDGDAEFHNYSNVEPWEGGGSDDAGFVQAIFGRSDNIQRLNEIGEEMSEAMRGQRPDVLGGVAAWKDDGAFLQTIYFKSESEARANENKEMPAELKAAWEEMDKLQRDLEYVDLTEPWLTSP